MNRVNNGKFSNVFFSLSNRFLRCLFESLLTFCYDYLAENAFFQRKRYNLKEKKLQSVMCSPKINFCAKNRIYFYSKIKICMIEIKDQILNLFL
jgi:hypothetical protein